MPPPERPQLAVLESREESQESQDDFGEFEFDLSDPNLVAALDGQRATEPDYKQKEETLRQVRYFPVRPTFAYHFHFRTGFERNTIPNMEEFS